MSIGDFEIGEMTPAPAPSVVERLKARALDPGEPVDPKTAAHEARARLVALLASLNDPKEVKGVADALVALDKVLPADASEDADIHLERLTDDEVAEFKRLYLKAGGK